MPNKPNEREYRIAQVFECRANDDESYIVEGYATTFNDPYVLYSWDGVDYKECVDRNAFDGADMNDVIFQYDHEGKVFARQKNGTLFLNADDHGLHVRADLSKTESASQMYEEIKAGLVSEMSFAFTVAEDKYNSETHTRTITKFKKIYDVSAVSIPANPGTNIAARSYFEGVIEAERQELARAEALALAKAKFKFKENNDGN